MERLDATPSVAETVAVAGGGAANESQPEIASITSHSSADEGRFVPGTLLGGRYRVIGLLGRGGMGEVYRATDLTLGQSVALKFLPPEASENPRLLERFHGEVRVARMVSHPNICRVYDIGVVDGSPFISMDYVDGEDLASLLTRIGRLPADKAIETARKLCAGLAAAHDRDVIHRDLKPQNIMMNKRGEVIIMDFGLAAIADQLSGAEVRNGTPAYMAPEQLRGDAVSARSDIYSLGLVLYEVFTGKRPSAGAKSVQQLIDLQESGQLTSMTSIAAEIDPAVEKAIRRCLDPDPAKRPSSALSVAALLPGGDPLAAALAAGETPSPEMVAAHGHSEGLARKYSLPCLAFIAICLGLAPAITQYTRAYTHTPVDLSPDVLGEKSRELASAFGYSRPPADSWLTLDHRTAMIRYLRRFPMPRPWDDWFTVEAPFQSIYRESLSALVAPPYGEVDGSNPPANAPGMVTVTLDAAGKLLSFEGVPYATDGPGEVADIPHTVFQAARLDLSRFQEIPPPFVPPHASDSVHAWRGPHPKFPDTELTVQIASWKGRITQAEVRTPWLGSSSTGLAGGWVARTGEVITTAGVGVLWLMVALLARRNWKLGRVDHKGALRLGILRFFLAFLTWAGSMHPVPGRELLGLTSDAAATWLFSAAGIWLLYLALEPAVRANWPHSIVTWNRLLAGRWLDPQVGAHVLIGAAVGCGIFYAIRLVALLFPDPLNGGGNLWYAVSTRGWVAGHAQQVATCLWLGLIAFFVIFALRRLVRNHFAAAFLAAVLFTLAEGEVARSSEWSVVAIYIGLFAVIIFVLLRLGLVATIAAVYFLNSFGAITLGSNWKTWYAPAGIATLTLLMGIALFAFWRSLGDRELLGSD
jgi:hypothetical protein